MTYYEKLKAPLWQRKRLEIFQRDSWACKKCGSVDKELQIHHLDYITGIEPWKYPNSMLITLCTECHNEEGEQSKHEKYLLQSLKINGFLAADILRLSTLLDCNKKFVKYLKIIVRRSYDEC